MPKTSAASPSAETAVEELLQATWQVLRRLRAESNTDGLTWSQTTALGQLRRHGAMTTAELARLESVKPQSMGATLAYLEEAGLVARRPHPSDGRQVLFALTPAALARSEERSRVKRRWLSDALAKLDPTEQRALLAAVDPLKRLANS
jgi:DNA-binding MarR family transcriptional regulator